MSEALKCDLCGKFVEVGDAKAAAWLTVVSTVQGELEAARQAGQNVDDRPLHFCGALDAGQWFLTQRDKEPEEVLLGVLEAANWLAKRDTVRWTEDSTRLARLEALMASLRATIADHTVVAAK
jgi:hypothetical protein